MAKAETESKPRVQHLDGCPADRTETYEQKGPKGFQLVTRCVDCGEHVVSRPTSDSQLATMEG